MTVTSSASYCREACEASLARLDTPSIELYYCHRLNKSTPVEETVQAIAQLQKDGKIRHLGLSECSAESLRRACAIASIAAVQVDYSPIGCGMITGQMRSRNDFQANDFRKMMPCSSAEKFTKNLQLVDENKGCTATQLTLAWLSLRCGEPDSSPSRFAAMTVS
jgi:aryl-alcohol dehydrogenase-like predicted oxidoreductase